MTPVIHTTQHQHLLVTRLLTQTSCSEWFPGLSVRTVLVLTNWETTLRALFVQERPESDTHSRLHIDHYLF